MRYSQIYNCEMIANGARSIRRIVKYLPRLRARGCALACFVLLSSAANAGASGGLLLDGLGALLGDGARALAQSGVEGARRAVVGSSAGSCPQFFPGGKTDIVAALGAQWRPVLLCSSNFAVIHSGLTKTPLVAIERLNADILRDALDEQRSNEFFPDPRLPRSQRSELHDFAGTSMDRGHLVPAADSPNPVAMRESFALSNIVHQDPVHNRKTWAKVEADTRHYIRRAKGDVFVFTGPVFRGQPKMAGKSGVWIPTHLFKLVYDPVTGRSWAHFHPNSSEAKMGPPISYPQFLSEVGWDLLPGIVRK